VVGKKDENRFTLQFDPNDERHQKAIRILNSQGRRKANYIANLIFSNCNDDGTTLRKDRIPPLTPSSNSPIPNKKEPQKNNILLCIDDDEMDKDEMALIRKSADAFIR